MKKRSFLSIFTISAVLLLLLSSCKNDIEDKASEKSEKVKVSFSVNDFAARTIAATDMTETDITKISLTAERKVDGTYSTYTFEDGSTELSWDSLTSMQEASVSLDLGLYNFTLNIYTNSSITSEDRITQSKTLEGQSVTTSTSTISFATAYASDGDVSVDLVWDVGTDGTNPVATVKAGLFTFDSKGETAVEGYEVESLEPAADETNTTSYSVTYAKNVDNGTYYLKFYLYDANDRLMNTVTEIVKVYGYKTTGQIDIDVDKLNIYYTVTYNLNDDSASWVDEDETGSLYRNAYTAVILPSGTVINAPANCTFAGWYTDASCSSGSKISEIGAGSDYAQDYTLYARWVVSTSITVTFDESSDIGVTTTEDTENYTITFTADEGYTSYTWYLDNEAQDVTANTITLDASDWVTGVYDVYLVAVDSEGESYSYTAQINWTQTYVITFVSDGETVETQKVLDGNTATAPTDVTSENGTVAGWYTDEELTTEFDFETVPTGDMTLYAKWTSTAGIFVSVNVDETSDITVNYETTTEVNSDLTDVTATISFTADEGYESYTWKVDGTVQDVTTNTIDIDASDWLTGVYDVSLVATDSEGESYSYTAQIEWTEVYLVNFISQDASVDAQIVLDGDLATEPTVSYSDSTADASIEGWYIDSDYSEAFDLTTAPTSDLTLYAKWKIMTTASISVDIDVDETSDISVTYAVDEDSASISFTANEGYESYAWTLDGEDMETSTDTPNVLTVDTLDWVTGVYEVALIAKDSSGSLYSYLAQINWAPNGTYLYVDASATSTGTGTESRPFASISSALACITDESEDYTIAIVGSLEGAQIEIPSTITAKSLTITGATGLNSSEYPQDSIDRGLSAVADDGTALVISTTVPVTITNLEITGGYATLGGGLNIAQGATVTLGEGAVITGNKTGSNGRGGAVHNEGTLFVTRSAVIGDPTASATATSSSYGNYATTGAGIFNGSFSDSSVAAALYLGYDGFDEDNEPIESEWSGGIYYNTASKGGAIFNADGSSLYYASGNLNYNFASGGGGAIYNDAGAVATMTGGNILCNTVSSSSETKGGAIYNAGIDDLNNVTASAYATFYLGGGLINENQALCSTSGTTARGGAVFNGGLFFMYGDAVIGNSDATTSASADEYGNYAKEGGAIYNYKYTSDGYAGQLYLGYSDADTTSDLTGGIYQNYANPTYSNSQYGGGAIYNNGSVTMNSGTIACNATSLNGGAIYTTTDLTLTGGTISDNAASSNGGAICLISNTSDITLNVSDSILIPVSDDSNDIYLGSSSTITLAGALEDNFAARVTPASYTAEKTVLKEAVEDNISTYYSRFSVTDDSDGNAWEIDSSGCLAQPTTATGN